MIEQINIMKVNEIKRIKLLRKLAAISKTMCMICCLLLIIVLITPVTHAFTEDEFELGINSIDAQKGKLNIELNSYQLKNQTKSEIKGTVKISVGDAVTYIPTLTNKGEDCYIRLKLLARAGKQDINILKYCQGFEDIWEYKDGWFYSKSCFRKGNEIEICRGFEFPSEWNYIENNLLEVTVIAQAISDENDNKGEPKTGDEYNGIIILLAVASLECIICILMSKKRREQ